MVESDPKKIILVDDMTYVLIMLKEFLEASGFTVAAFDDPIAALQEVTTTHPDIFITDLHMPVMDGLQLIEAVKVKHPSIPCILMTGDPKKLKNTPTGFTLIDKNNDFPENMVRAIKESAGN